jgi:hypothetical protein
VTRILDPDFYLSPESHAGAVLDEIVAAHAADWRDDDDYASDETYVMEETQ